MVIMSYVDMASIVDVSCMVFSVRDGLPSAQMPSAIFEVVVQRPRMNGAHVEGQYNLQDTSPKTVTYLN